MEVNAERDRQRLEKQEAVCSCPAHPWLPLLLALVVVQLLFSCLYGCAVAITLRLCKQELKAKLELAEAAAAAAALAANASSSDTTGAETVQGDGDDDEDDDDMFAF